MSKSRMINKLSARLSALMTVFLLAVSTIAISANVQAQEQTQVSMNFRDAEIESMIESVAEITGRSFVIDPRVSGRVTIIAPQTMDTEMLYQAFLSALQVQGFQAVEDGAIVRIVPFNQAFGILGQGGDNEIETRLIKVNNVDAQSLVPVVKPLLTAASRLQAFAPSNYLIVSDIRSNVEALVAIVAEIDDPSQAEIEVVSLEYISAAEAVHIIGQFQQLQAQGLSVVEDSLNNRLILAGPSAARRALKSMLRSLDIPTIRAAGIEVIRLDYARAEELKPIIDGMLESDIFLQVADLTQVAGDNNNQTSFRVEVDLDNNALIVAASAGVIREIKNVVAQLDVSRPQVLIEAVIAELSEDQAKRLSSQLVVIDQGSGGYLSKFDNVLTTLLGTATDGDVSDGDITSLGQAIGDSNNGFFVGGSFDADDGRGIGVLIQALETDSLTRVLSTPSVLTLDNEVASLEVGEEVPFITGSFTTGNNSATNPFQTVEREQVGIKLTVEPQISKGDAVRLSIALESSKLLNNASQRGTADVVTSKSTIETNVMVEDGELLILGGLIDGQFDTLETKIPILGDIPLLGALFRSSSRDNDNRVLMMFIRPTILRDAETAREVSEKRFNHLIRLDLESEEGGNLSLRLEEFLEDQ